MADLVNRTGVWDDICVAVLLDLRNLNGFLPP